MERILSMKLLAPVAVLSIIALASIASAQPAASQSASLSPSQTRFWAFFFSSIANPTEAPQELAIRENIIIQKFGLNSSEAAELHATAAQFYSAAAEVRAQANNIVSGKTSLSASDIAALAALDTLQGQRIAIWANNFMGHLRPVIASRITRVIH
jgi:hypothetical protein